MKRSISKNFYFKWPSKENVLTYKNGKETNATIWPNMLKKHIFEK